MAKEIWQAVYSEEYIRLFQKMSTVFESKATILPPKSKNKELSIQFCELGEHYVPAAKDSFMIVGRAVNGWDMGEHYFGDKNYSEYVHDEITELKNREASIQLYATANRSAFWRTANRIYKELTLSNERTIHENVKSMAWSNLYKIGYMEKGNPSFLLMDKQKELCADILCYEISTLQPTYISFCVGKQHSGQENILGSLRKRLKMDETIINEETSNFMVSGIISHDDGKQSKYVITYRPEAKNEDEYVHAVISALK